jgi:hypothetical protein
VPTPFPRVVRGLLLTDDAEPLYVRSEIERGLALEQPDGIGPPPVLRARSRHRQGARDGVLWWPPSRAAGRHLAAYLATARETHQRRSRRANDEALDLTLLLAEHDARAGDSAMALRALDCAESLAGGLPAQYAAKRRLLLAGEDAAASPERGAAAFVPSV